MANEKVVNVINVTFSLTTIHEQEISHSGLYAYKTALYTFQGTNVMSKGFSLSYESILLFCYENKCQKVQLAVLL